ncbi:hypothetical protein A2Z33_03905 [Candidatus Gottesmanbacteria bacterium RBG_16_52_11]|uniref:Sulfotransferase domain-containing protein n=1 Tax=Candidatus Gottesmanbacteria bacterium RBG_16_52_11 TaxID=1798374 RepID=A0A1F5YVW9_9BACT|nr:MAG: hypothetical protein A2Z33_03905 [Candidatus Gottesmanbacteria bacterium RBG_16_52_11]
MPKKFKLVMISAMYENGGNTLQRHLDGHPELYVYPFESQPGTFMVQDFLTSLFPQKYRWPEFGISGDTGRDYEMIIDEEFKVRVNTPHVSKFRHVSDLGCTNADRKKVFLRLMKGKARTRANLMEAFYRSTFEAWKTRKNSGREIVYVGYSPIIGVDSDKIIADFPDSIILHIVRNPYAAYAETKRRPVPYTLSRYTRTWNIMQLAALNFAGQYPKNVVVVRFEDMVADKVGFFRKLSKTLGIRYSDTMTYPSWNGKKLDHQYPWGTIEIPTEKANRETTNELNRSERELISSQSGVINKALGYDKL